MMNITQNNGCVVMKNYTSLTLLDDRYQTFLKMGQSLKRISLALDRFGHFMTWLFLTPYFVFVTLYIFCICTYQYVQADKLF